ncbi:TadE/TadG family type IV pilus assembly protein [Paenibacillus sp. 1P07SE]|uniref:TadE/TadG family type IV pilus assembly protein n=1 Tax=Paenibacillus sp. 1P07SE TaxID=3132209 RepID=UPI0039A71B0B
MTLHTKQSSKPRRRDFFGSPDGAITVFFSLVMAGILLFTAVLIDFGRIAAADRKLEIAAQSGIRSVLSAYDEMLYSRYGLFARGGSDADGILERVADQSLTSPEGGFQLLPMEREASHVNPSQVMGTHDVFKRQVLEEMKYKAPIDFTMDMISRFKPLSGAMKEATATVNLLEQMRKLYESREKALKEALTLQRTVAAIGADSGLKKLIPTTIGSHLNDQTAWGIVAEYGNYTAWLASDARTEDGTGLLYAAAIAAYQSSARSTADEIYQAASRALVRQDPLLQEAIAEVEKAQDANRAMHELAKSAAASAPGGYDRLQNADSPGVSGDGVTSEVSEELVSIRKMADDLVLADDYFELYKTEIREQLTDFRAVEMEGNAFRATVNAALNSLSAHPMLEESLGSLNLSFTSYITRYSQPGTVLEQRHLKLPANGPTAKLQKEKEAAAAGMMKDARALLQRMSLSPQIDEHREAFEQLRARFEDSVRFNAYTGDAGPADGGSDASEETASTEAEQAMNGLGGLFGSMGEAVTDFRDTLYLNEFAAQRFAHFPPQKLQNLFTDGGSEEFAHSLNVSQQELEYVLYGIHHPAGNVSAAYGEIFAVRLAIRTMEGLIESRGLGHPLLILAAAVVYGIAKSVEDVLELVRTGKTELSKYAKVDVRYVDYLRIFLMVQSSAETKMSRMIALMEHNTGYRLAMMPTGASAEITASLRLWFLPGMMKQLARTGLLDGKVTGNRYESTKTVAWSYS